MSRFLPFFLIENLTVFTKMVVWIEPRLCDKGVGRRGLATCSFTIATYLAHEGLTYVRYL